MNNLFGGVKKNDYLCIIKQNKIKQIKTMAKRKYDYYTLATELDETTFESYQEAFSAYNKEEDSATLYGTDEQGDVSVIMSK